MDARRAAIVVGLWGVSLCAARGGASAEEAGGLRLVKSIPLPGVEGRIDHLAIDAAGKRLVVAALENGTVEVVDVEKGEAVHRLDRQQDPTGIAILPESGRIVVANAGDGTVRFYDGTSFEIASTVEVGNDADNVRIGGDGRVYVGYGKGGIAVIEKGTHLFDMHLKGHPESFQLEAKTNRIYVNVPDAGHVAVLDRAEKTTVATWWVKDAKKHYPMLLDEENHRLLLGCREPAKMLVLDTTTGKVVAQIAISGDVDDMWLDATTKRIYLSCGEGFLDVVQQKSADQYERIARVPTGKLARTCLFVPSTGLLYLAVPHDGSQRTEIRIYKTRE